MARYPGVSQLVARRLPRYYRYLGDMLQNGVERISSREFAGIIGFTASQIRQDLNCFGGFGRQGYGYNVATLHAEIGRILGLDHSYRAILIGAGNLGYALANNMDFAGCGFELRGIFDNNPDIIGKPIKEWVVRGVDELPAFCGAERPIVAVLCVPTSAAAELVTRLIELGIRCFWNYTHFDIQSATDQPVVVENVHLGDNLMTMRYNLGEMMGE